MTVEVSTGSSQVGRIGVAPSQNNKFNTGPTALRFVGRDK